MGVNDTGNPGIPQIEFGILQIFLDSRMVASGGYMSLDLRHCMPPCGGDRMATCGYVLSSPGNQQGSIRPSVHLILSGRAAIVRLAPLSFSALCPSCTLRVVLLRLCVSWSSAKVQEMIMILATFETVDGEPWAKFRSGYSRCELIPYFLIARALAVSHLAMHVFLI